MQVILDIYIIKFCCDEVAEVLIVFVSHNHFCYYGHIFQRFWKRQAW